MDDTPLNIRQESFVRNAICDKHIAFKITNRTKFLMDFVEFTIHLVPSVWNRSEIDCQVTQAGYLPLALKGYRS